MRIITTLLGIALLQVSLTASWGFTIEHKGKRAPNYQEWTGGDFSGTTLRIPRFAPRASVQVGPSNQGEPAWKIHDTSTAVGSNFVYMRGITDEQAAVAMEARWTLEFRVKVGESPNTGPGPIGVIFSTGTRRFLIQPYRDGDGILNVKLSTGPGTEGIYHSFPAADAYAFHTYILQYDPFSDACIFYFDNSSVESNYPGRLINEAFPYLSMGSGDDNDRGEGLYALVRFKSSNGPHADCTFSHFGAEHPLSEDWNRGRWVGTALLPSLRVPTGITLSPLIEEAKPPSFRIADHGSEEEDDYAFYRTIPSNRAQSHVLPPWPHKKRFCRIRVSRVCDVQE